MVKSRDKRIAIFLPSLRGGGAERTIANLARGFADSGIKVDLVLAKGEGHYLYHLPPNIRTVDLNAPRVFISLPGLVRYLRKERPYALLTALSHANIVGLFAVRIARVQTRIVVSEHNTLSQVFHNVTDFRVKIIPFFISMFYRWADAIVAVSKGVADDLIKHMRIPCEKLHVIYNPVVTAEIFSKSIEPLSHPWFGPKKPPIILGVGRLTQQKDFSALIRAFAQVRNICPARLIILGEGEERSILEALVKKLGLEKDVSLPGFVSNPYNYMKRASVFVLSSKWEGLPTVLIEAVALGTPVVSTDCPNGPREILENGRYGNLVPVGEPESLARAILSALNNPPKPASAATWRRFNLDEALRAYIKVLGINKD